MWIQKLSIDRSWTRTHVYITWSFPTLKYASDCEQINIDGSTQPWNNYGIIKHSQDLWFSVSLQTCKHPSFSFRPNWNFLKEIGSSSSRSATRDKISLRWSIINRSNDSVENFSRFKYHRLFWSAACLCTPTRPWPPKKIVVYMVDASGRGRIFAKFAKRENQKEKPRRFQ